ncbi:MAG: hypothetical protein LC658_03980, partial [Bacteroidales bacterium]|nr:hypothetical protein [Bacteroidales bacterium]
MDSKQIIKIVSYSLGVISLVFLFWWLRADPTRDFAIHVEGADNRGAGAEAQDVEIGEYFEQFATGYAELSETWPRFRGEDFDNISKSPVNLIDNFGSDGPKILWSKELGEG